MRASPAQHRGSGLGGARCTVGFGATLSQNVPISWSCSPGPGPLLAARHCTETMAEKIADAGHCPSGRKHLPGAGAKGWIPMSYSLQGERHDNLLVSDKCH